ncbi:MAG: DUF421 domain-containing protein [Clostridia bacterium]|nr:DUF421 domain-containing protein [Clostridia bacterium]
MVSILIRTLIIYFLLTFTLRIMGKRQLGELDVGDLVSTLLMSELAAIPIDDPDIPLLNAVVPILFILSIEIIASTLKNKSEKLKHVLDGGNVFIIYKGRLSQKALRDTRISVNELMASARAQGIGDLSEIEYAILEQNGGLSVLEKNKSNMAHAVVIDGTVIEQTVKRLGLNDKWLNFALKKDGKRLEDVFLMTVDDSGEVRTVKKEREDKL